MEVVSQGAENEYSDMSGYETCIQNQESMYDNVVPDETSRQESTYDDVVFDDVVPELPDPTYAVVDDRLSLHENHETRRTSQQVKREQKYGDIHTNTAKKLKSCGIFTCIISTFAIINLLAVIGIGVVVWYLYQERNLEMKVMKNVRSNYCISMYMVTKWS